MTVLPAEPRSRVAADPRRGWTWIGLPIAIFAGTRVVQLLLVRWMGGPSVRDRLLAWDAGWFVRLARDGYPRGYDYSPDGDVGGNGLAFFPLYPLLIRVVHLVTRLDYETAALAVAWLAAAVSAVLIYALGAGLWNDRVAAALTVLVCAQPMSAVLSMAYSESLLLAFVAGALLATFRDRWVLAGTLGLAAALTRPSGAAVAVALGVAALTRFGQRGRRRWLPVAATAVAASGVPLFVAWVGYRVADPNAWFRVQGEGWGTRFDFGRSVGAYVLRVVRNGDGWVQVSVAWLLIAAVVAVIVAVVAPREPLWPPLVVYGVVALILVVGQSGYYHSKPRLLVPVLLTLVPVALGVARARTRTAVLVLIGFALFGLWYGAYLITVWRYAV
jgi:hypothetical protein